MCYGEISGIDRDYHDYPESTIAQKVIFESSLWMLRILNHLRTISQPSQLSQYQSAWSLVWLTTTSGPEKCLQMPCNIFYIQVDLKNSFFLSKSAKTISKPSQNHLNHLKTISSRLNPSQFSYRWYLGPFTSQKSTQRQQPMCFASQLDSKTW